MIDLIKRKKKYIEFDVVGSVLFDPGIGAPKFARWNFGDGTIIDTTNSPIYVYADTSDYHVKIWLRNLNLINSFACQSDGVKGSLDLSLLKNCTAYTLNSNPLLTSIINPVSSAIITKYLASSCNITGVLDLSGLTGLGGDIQLQLNPLLTSIINPVSSETITRYWLYNCTNYTGSLDLSTLTGLGTSFYVRLAAGLTSIINPITSNTFILYYAFSCNLAYIDFTVMPNMTDVNNCTIRLDGNGMTAAEVNHILVDFDTISIDGGYTGRSIRIDGTNAAPDGTSGGFDGLTAKANLITKNFTVTTN